jgi:hypothetical protein
VFDGARAVSFVVAAAFSWADYFPSGLMELHQKILQQWLGVSHPITVPFSHDWTR